MALPPEDDGPYEVLSEHGDVSVYRCDRGCLHLQIGNMNVRLEEDEFQELAAVVAQAAQRSNTATPSRPAPRYGRVQ
jgi:hypothetical protein